MGMASGSHKDGENAYRILVGKHGGKRPFRKPRGRYQYDIKTGLKEIGWNGEVWVHVTWDRDNCRNPMDAKFNPYPTAFPYGNGMVLHFYQQQESSTTKTVHKVINKRLKTYV